ncbi:MAG: hypothetical protein IKR54_03835, partial [Lachnospiraceae bacterium]|nr:hypothetical protein [Lachnospiraceae bacterium]
MKGAKRIIKKELARVFKDKKLIFTMYIMPAILMFVIYGLIGNLMSSMNNDITEHTDIVTVVNAPESFKQTVSANVSTCLYIIFSLVVFCPVGFSLQPSS